MARRIIHDDVDVEIGRNVPLDLIKEFAEFPCAMIAACIFQQSGPIVIDYVNRIQFFRPPISSHLTG